MEPKRGDVGHRPGPFDTSWRLPSALEPGKASFRNLLGSGRSWGYAVLPGQSQNPERYYDDNVWVAWAALEAYQATHDRTDLDVALKAYNFVMSGEDSILGGGIYWQQRTKSEKNACINAPAAAVSFRLYKLTKETKFLENGDRLLSWTRRRLQDTDGLLFDHIQIDGSVDRTKWSYNSACYVRALITRYELLRNPIDKEEAIRVLRASQSKWIDPETRALINPGPFGQHLLDAFYEAAATFKEPQLAKTATATILSVIRNCADENGLYGEWWNRPPLANEDRNLKNLASVLRSIFAAEASSLKR